MFTRATLPITLLIMLIIGMIVSGCGDSGPRQITLDTSPFVRYTGQDEPRPGRVFDLLDGTRRFNMPRFSGMGFSLGSLDDPALILGSFDVPSDTREYYPLRAHTKFDEPAQLQAWLTGAQITPGLLAGSLARTARMRTRPLETINFQDPDTGISWMGSSALNEDKTEITLDVIGRRDGLGIRLILTATTEATTDIDTIIGNTQYTYTLTIFGQVANGSDETDTVDGVMTASGAIDVDIADIDAGSGSLDQTLNSRIRFAINKRVCYQADSDIDLNYVISGGSMAGLSLSLANDGWFFAPDGYWIHGTSSMDLSEMPDTGPTATAAFDLEASDGYHITLTDGAGTLTDASGNVLATLTFHPTDGYVDLDFSDELNALGLEDDALPIIPL